MVKLKVRKGKSKKKSKIKTNKISRRKSRRKSKIKISRRKSRRKSKIKISRRKSRRKSKIKISRRKSKIKISRRKSRRKSKKKTVSVNKNMLGGELGYAGREREKERNIWLNEEKNINEERQARSDKKRGEREKKEEYKLQNSINVQKAIEIFLKIMFGREIDGQSLKDRGVEIVSDSVRQELKKLRPSGQDTSRRRPREEASDDIVNLVEAARSSLSWSAFDEETNDNRVLLVLGRSLAPPGWTSGDADGHERLWYIYEVAIDFYKTIKEVEYLIAEERKKKEREELYDIVIPDGLVSGNEFTVTDPRSGNVVEMTVPLEMDRERTIKVSFPTATADEPYPHYKKEAQAIKKLIEDSLCGDDKHPWNWDHEMSGINNLIKKAKRLFSGFKPVHDWKSVKGGIQVWKCRSISRTEKLARSRDAASRTMSRTTPSAALSRPKGNLECAWEDEPGQGWKNLHTGEVRAGDFRSDPPGLGEDEDVIVRHLKTTTEDHLSPIQWQQLRKLSERAYDHKRNLWKWVPMNSAERLLRRDGFYGSARGNQCRSASAGAAPLQTELERLDDISLCIREELWNYYWEDMLQTQPKNKEYWDNWWTKHWEKEQEIAAGKLKEFYLWPSSTKKEFVVWWNTEMARDALGPGIEAKHAEMRTELAELIQVSLNQKNKEDKVYWGGYWVKYWEPDQVKWENELLQRHQEHILVMREKMEELSWEWSPYIPSQKKQLKELKKSVNKGREKIEREKREDKRERWVDLLVRLGIKLSTTDSMRQSSSGPQRSPAAVAELQSHEAQSTFEPAEPPMSSSLLPPGWEKVVDPSSGKHYYQHVASHTSSWTVPTHEPASPSSGSKPNTTAGDMVQSSAPQRSAAELAKIKNQILNMKRPALEAELTKRGIQLESLKCTHTKRRCSKSFLKNLVIKNLDKTYPAGPDEVDDPDL